jgi:hypothetical protein
MTNWLSRKAKGEQFLLTTVEALAAEDNYEKGEIGPLRQTMYEKENKRFDSIEELLEHLERSYGLSVKKSDYVIADPGKIETYAIQDEDGRNVETTDVIYKKFIEGKARLWNVIFKIGIEVIKAAPASVDELHTLGFSE